jgi:hypothetical protein
MGDSKSQQKPSCVFDDDDDFQPEAPRTRFIASSGATPATARRLHVPALSTGCNSQTSHFNKTRPAQSPAVSDAWTIATLLGLSSGIAQQQKTCSCNENNFCRQLCSQTEQFG